MGSVSHVDEAKKYLVKDVHRLAHLGAPFEDSPNGGIVFITTTNHPLWLR